MYTNQLSNLERSTLIKPIEIRRHGDMQICKEF